MRYIVSCFLFAMLIGVAGCSEEKKEVKTVEYYKEHAEERKAVLEQCLDNPGELADDPNCINAIEAKAKTSAGRMRDMKF